MQKPHTAPQQPQRFARLPEVESLTSLKKTSLYAMAREGKFPKPVRLGRRAVAWPLGAVQAWIEARIAAAGSAE